MKVLLNNDWQMTVEPLSCDSTQAHRIMAKNKDWLDVQLPCDVHMPLIEQGVIPEPLTADNCFKSEWLEERSFWFKNEMVISPELLNSEHIVLTLESLDAEADIWLNGVHLGHQHSAFYPFAADVKHVLAAGENVLLVRVTTGIEHYSRQDIASVYETAQGALYDNVVAGIRGEERRVIVRKPQYVYGFDWNPRVATCGIMKDVWIDFGREMGIRSVHAVTETIAPDVQVRFDVEMERFHPLSTGEAELKIEIWDQAELVSTVHTEVYMRSGLNYVTLRANIPNAKLWWPNGMGEQPLYTIKATASSENVRVDYPPFKIGLRSLRLNTDKIGGQERNFSFEVNGVSIYGKGGNWVPADSIYARIPEGKYDILIKEAKEANFNMLRLWGGGIYEPDHFFDKCDEAGILLWHDFIFVCAKYPDHLGWFREEVERELDYQTKRLRNHCSIALWCGNNENHLAQAEWSWTRKPNASFFGGKSIYNEIAPKIVQQNCPEIPYWNGSPYGGSRPNSEDQGDIHNWWTGALNPDVNVRTSLEIFTSTKAKFISEYGSIGPCCRTTIEQYLGDSRLERHDPVWKLHTNTFERDTVAAGIQKLYLDKDNLELDEYLLYGGLFHGFMLGRSLEAHRSRRSCFGSLFWMYNDCWGETGWTIIDYYLRRKIAYYFVKRAFEPTKLLLRKQGDAIEIVAVNETNRAYEETLAYGVAGYDGTEQEPGFLKTIIAPYSREVVGSVNVDPYNEKQCFFYIKPASESSPFGPALFRPETFKEQATVKPNIRVADIRRGKGEVRFTLISDKYAHAVHFGLPDAVRLKDEYFDLLKDTPKEVVIYNPPDTITAESIKPRAIY